MASERRGFGKGQLERVAACPACGSSDRTLAFEGLSDHLFGAPGEWTLMRCGRCGSLYLDPRPAREAIALAYEGYFTHAASTDSPAARLRSRDPAGAAARGWLNLRYGHRLADASPLAGLFLAPRRRREAAYLVRHLPPPAAPEARLIDIGCGSGAFLPLAEALGYRASGVDADPEAVAAARAQGLDAHFAGLPQIGLPPGSFEQATMLHVVEHLHDPAASLAHVLDLLAPGGRLWLSQPNAAAHGLDRFGRDWRGLEPPRHLALYTPEALFGLLERAGFVRARLVAPEQLGVAYAWFSFDVRFRRDPAQPVPEAPAVIAEGRRLERLARSDPSRAESVTMIAFKPS